MDGYKGVVIMHYHDHEHVKSLLEEGYNESDIAEVMGHSKEWVKKARKWNRGI